MSEPIPTTSTRAGRWISQAPAGENDRACGNHFRRRRRNRMGRGHSPSPTAADVRGTADPAGERYGRPPSRRTAVVGRSGQAGEGRLPAARRRSTGHSQENGSAVESGVRQAERTDEAGFEPRAISEVARAIPGRAEPDAAAAAARSRRSGRAGRGFWAGTRSGAGRGFPATSARSWPAAARQSTGNATLSE